MILSWLVHGCWAGWKVVQGSPRGLRSLVTGLAAHTSTVCQGSVVTAQGRS